MTDSQRKKPQLRAKERLAVLPFNRIVPNMVTLIALCTGLSAIRFALKGEYEFAVGAILIAAILDAMDGRLARMMGVSSHFGAELDSLSDCVSFGVAPAVVMYIATLHEWGRLGWAVSLFFVICMLLRLARFNTNSLNAEEEPAWKKRFFQGIPAPAGGLLALFSIIVGLAIDLPWLSSPYLNAAWLVFIGLLMISRIPTYSLKGKQIEQRSVLPVMLAVGITIAAFLTAPWYTLIAIALVYLSSIPFSYLRFQSLLKSEEEAEEEAA